MTRFADNYRRVARTLGRIELSQHSLDEQEDLLHVEPDEASRRFLDFYGDVGILTALDRYGLLDAMRRRGYDDFSLSLRAEDERHALAVHALHIGGGPSHRIVELAVRRDHLYASQVIPDAGEIDLHVLTIDWLALQDPARPFRLRRLRLPGQTWPGLGVGERVLEILQQMARRLEMHGVLTVAEHLHNAVLYAREMPFLDPEDAGRLDALVGTLMERHGLSLTQASWAVDWGFVRTKGENRPFVWRGEAQVVGWHPLLESWLESRTWQELREASAAKHAFRLEEAAFERAWARRLESLLDPPAP